MRISRTRSRSTQPVGAGHPLGTPTKGLSPNTGPLATAAWLIARGLSTREPRWYAEITLGISDHAPGEDAATLFRTELFSEEWGCWFRHDGKASWIRVTDVPFVHGRDDHGLLHEVTGLKHVGAVVRRLEERFAIRLVRERAAVRTSLFGAEAAIREWIASW